jgi:hypothetical protein
MTPESPPMVNMPTKPRAKQSGVLNRRRPPQSVASQFRIFTPVGTAISMLADEKAASATGPRPTANM